MLIGGKQLFQQHVTGMSRGTIGWNTNHFILLMIVHDLDLVGALLCPEKTNAVLVNNADAVLTLPVATQRFGPVTRWNT